MKKISILILILAPYLPFCQEGGSFPEREKEALGWWASLPGPWRSGLSAAFAIPRANPYWTEVEAVWKARALDAGGWGPAGRGVLEKFSLLEELDISGSGMDISHANFPHLKKLVYRGFPGKRFEGVSAPSLQWLDLSGSPELKNIPGVRSFPLLKRAYLSGSGLTNLEDFRGCASLSVLEASRTKIESAAPLKGLASLWFLDLRGTKTDNYAAHVDTSSVEVWFYEGEPASPAGVGGNEKTQQEAPAGFSAYKTASSGAAGFENMNVEGYGSSGGDRGFFTFKADGLRYYSWPWGLAHPAGKFWGRSNPYWENASSGPGGAAGYPERIYRPGDITENKKMKDAYGKDLKKTAGVYDALKGYDVEALFDPFVADLSDRNFGHTQVGRGRGALDWSGKKKNKQLSYTFEVDPSNPYLEARYKLMFTKNRLNLWNCPSFSLIVVDDAGKEVKSLRSAMTWDPSDPGPLDLSKVEGSFFYTQEDKAGKTQDDWYSVGWSRLMVDLSGHKGKILTIYFIASGGRDPITGDPEEARAFVDWSCVGSPVIERHFWLPSSGESLFAKWSALNLLGGVSPALAASPVKDTGAEVLGAEFKIKIADGAGYRFISRDYFRGLHLMEYKVKTYAKPLIQPSKLCLEEGAERVFDIRVKDAAGNPLPGFEYYVNGGRTDLNQEWSANGLITIKNYDYSVTGRHKFYYSVRSLEKNMKKTDEALLAEVDFGPGMRVYQDPAAPTCERGVNLVLKDHARISSLASIKWYEMIGGAWSEAGAGGILPVSRDFDKPRSFKSVAVLHAGACAFEALFEVSPLKWSSRESVFTGLDMYFPGSLSFSAASFTDAPRTDTLGGDPWSSGRKGVWAASRSHVYFSSRQGPGSKAYEAWLADPQSTPRLTDARTGGVLETPGGQPGGQFFDWSVSPDLPAPEGWREASRSTHTSANGLAAEEKNVLGIYSAVLFGYGDRLVVAEAGAAKRSEIAFTGFEESSPGNWGISARPRSKASYYDVQSADGGALFVSLPFGQAEAVLKGRRVSARGTYFEGGASFVYDGLEVACVYPHPTPEKRENACVVLLEGFPVGHDPAAWSGELSLSEYIGAAQPRSVAVGNNDSRTTSGADPETVYLLEGRAAGHTGDRCLKVSGRAVFSQNFLNLEAGKKYVFSCWVKGGDAAAAGFEGEDWDGPEPQAGASGAAVEGWRRIEFSFVAGGPSPRLFLEAGRGPSGPRVAYFDDIRLYPEGSPVKTYVYEASTYRLRAVLDENNYASLYYYDAAGNLYLVKKETERGISTVQESRGGLPEK